MAVFRVKFVTLKIISRYSYICHRLANNIIITGNINICIILKLIFPGKHQGRVECVASHQREENVTC